MKLKLLILLFFLFTNPIHIRVLLMELDQGAISIKQQNNLQIHKLNSSKIAILPELIIKFIDNNLYLNDKIYIYKQPLIIRPLKDNIIDVGGVEYNGYIRVFVDDNKLKIINYLDLEDYVSSVLKTEGWPGWPLRFFEIQAIISRTYALNKIYNNRKNKLYDICNTNLHQTYQGSHQNENINKAVEATKGLFLAYNNKPIDAMFDSCCGGVNPAEISSIPHKKLPYLARNSDCNYCKKTKISNWSFSVIIYFIQSISS